MLLVGLQPGEAWVIEAWTRGKSSSGSEMESIEVSSTAAALAAVEQGGCSICFLSAALGEEETTRFLRRLRAVVDPPPVVALGPKAQEEVLVRALQEGAKDYLLHEELDPDRVLRCLRYTVELRRLESRRSRLEAELRAADARWRALHDLASEGVLMIGGTGRVEAVNRSALALLAAIERDLLGLDLDGLRALFGSGAAGASEEFPPRLALERYRSAAGVWPVLAGGGRLLTLRAVPFFAGAGQPSGAVVTLQEATLAEPPSELAEVAVDALLQSRRDHLQELLGDSAVLELALHAPGAVARCRPNELEEILARLLANAREAMPAGGLVFVRTYCAAESLKAGRADVAQRDEAPWLVLEVRDAGQGMDPAIRGRAFEPFFSTKGPGRGVGLARVRAIVERRGGYVSLESQPRRGSRVTLLLPRVR